MNTAWIILALVVALIVVIGFSCYRKQKQQHLARQLDGLESACMLLTLMKTIQQHRGVSSGILGGKADQQGTLRQLSSNADQQIQALSARLPATEQKQWQIILPQWQHIKDHWRQADVLDNFESHCNILQDIQAMMLDITDYSGLTSSDHQDAQRLAGEIFGNLPALIENIGQLRALSTHAAASHDCITAFRLHLQFLMDQLGKQNSQLARNNPSQANIAGELEALIGLVQQEILEAEKITIDPDRLFQNATQVMDNCFVTIDKGISQFKQTQFT